MPVFGNRIVTNEFIFFCVFPHRKPDLWLNKYIRAEARKIGIKMNTNKLDELRNLAELAGFKTTTLKHTHSTVLNIKIDAERSFAIEAMFENGSVRHIAENVFFYFGSRTSIKKVTEFLTSKVAA